MSTLIIEAGTAMNGTEATKQALIKAFKDAGFAPMSGNLAEGEYQLEVSNEPEYFGLRPYANAKGKGAIICLACSAVDQSGKEFSFGLPTEKGRTLAILENHLALVKQGSKVTMTVNEKGYIAKFVVSGSEASTTSSEPLTSEAINGLNKAELVALATKEGITFQASATAPQLRALLVGELV
jgi:hypothetical protein